MAINPRDASKALQLKKDIANLKISKQADELNLAKTQKTGVDNPRTDPATQKSKEVSILKKVAPKKKAIQMKQQQLNKLSPSEISSSEFSMESHFFDYLDELEEASNFIKGLAKKTGKQEKTIEKAWKKASDSYKNLKKKPADKYKYIAGVTKKIVQEDGAAPSGMPGGQTGINVAGFSPTTLASDIVPPGQYVPYKWSEEMFSRRVGKDKPSKKQSKGKFTFKKAVPTKPPKRGRYESVEVNNFIDNLFE